MEMTEREVNQAVEGMYHNLNTLQSRSGNQLPFSSINYGTCTEPEGRMVTNDMCTDCGYTDEIGDECPMYQNVRKLGRICQINDDLPKYSAYLNESNQFNILQREVEFVSLQKAISVLNTSVFFVLDYYGNKNGFYDDVMANR